jgi:hypothetical protein
MPDNTDILNDRRSENLRVLYDRALNEMDHFFSRRDRQLALAISLVPASLGVSGWLLGHGHGRHLATLPFFFGAAIAFCLILLDVRTQALLDTIYECAARYARELGDDEGGFVVAIRRRGLGGLISYRWVQRGIYLATGGLLFALALTS